MEWQTLHGIVVQGHGIASGRAEDSPYPAGSVTMQRPYFKAQGLDLQGIYAGTVNISIAPAMFSLIHPTYTFRNVRWTEIIPPEDFSFAHCQLTCAGKTYRGWVYYPHPDTKPDHFQSPSTMELLLPWVDGLEVGAAVTVRVKIEEIEIFSEETTTNG